MPSVYKINGHWFAYLQTRVLGPFNFEKQAWRAINEELELDKNA